MIMKMTLSASVAALLLIMTVLTNAQTVQYTMPGEDAEHEGTWIQWPHNHLYGPYYRDDVTPTFVSITNALQSGEMVHIIAYDASEQTYITNALTAAGVPMTNVDFYVFPTDDVWSRDNGPMFVYDLDNNLSILDWGFNGWGDDTPYAQCDEIPQSISTAIGIPRVDLSAMVLEGGAVEHDGHGTMMATRSSITHSSRNPNLTEEEIEDYMTNYMGITNFIWLDGVYGQEITDMHIDGFVKFANDSTIVTMSATNLVYWQVTLAEVATINNAVNVDGEQYYTVRLPLTVNDVVTTHGTNLGYKGSYCNYYIANNVVLVPTYNDPNDAVAIGIIQNLYPNRTAVGIDVRNLYEYGGMIHCVTQQQPVASVTSSISDADKADQYLLRSHPNPFNSMTEIRFTAKKNESAIIHIYNFIGQNVRTLQPAAGQNKVQLDGAQLESGIYFYTLSIDGQVKASNSMALTAN